MSPEELRQQIATAIAKRWRRDKPYSEDFATADAVLAVLAPAIRRALARDAAIDSTNEMESAPMSQALRSYYAFEDGHNHLLRRLRAVGTE